MRITALFTFCILLVATLANGDSYRLYDSTISPNVMADFQLTPDGTRAVLNSSSGLFSVPVVGGKLQKVNSQVGSVIGFQVAPNGQRIVYLDSGATPTSDELFATSISGGAIVKLNGPLPSQIDIRQSDYEITPNSQNVVFKAKTSQNKYALYSAGIGGGAPTVLDIPPDGFTVWNSAPFAPFRISPDSTTVLYNIKEDISPSDLPDTLFSVPVVGGASTQVGVPAIGSDGLAFNGYQITPDGQTAIYGVFVTNLLGELYRAPLNGGPPTLVTSPDGSGSARFADYIIAPDSSTLLYRGREGQSSIDELFSAPLSSGVPIRLNDPTAGAVQVYYFAMTPDGQTAVFTSHPNDDTNGEFQQLFSVPISGGANTPLTPPMLLSEQAISPDGKYVVFRSNHVNSLQYELFSVPVSGGDVVKLNLPMFSTGDALNFAFTSDGKNVVYTATPTETQVAELFQVSIEGGTSIKLNDPLTAGSTVVRTSPLKVTPDGRHVVFQFRDGATGKIELHAALIVPEPVTTTILACALVAISIVARRAYSGSACAREARSMACTCPLRR